MVSFLQNKLLSPSENQKKEQNEKANGELAVVTGSSSGIGFELVKPVAMNGFDLLICAEDASIVDAAGHGRILFTSSVAAFMPGPYETVYSASKAFVQSFAEGLHAEIKDKGIVVTALQPGPIDTNFFRRAYMVDTKVGQSKKDNPADVARQGYEALMAGRHAVIAGSLKK